MMFLDAEQGIRKNLLLTKFDEFPKKNETSFSLLHSFTTEEFSM